MVSFPAGHARSYWAATAVGYRERPALDGEVEVDVAVVGGGFTGLSAAYHLCGYGYRVAVLERHRVGWGASGRNAGFLLTGYKWSYATLARRFGLDGARAMLRFQLDAIDLVEEIVTRHRIPCDFRRCGAVVAAHRPRALEALRRAQAFKADALGYETWVLDRHAMAEELGSPHYWGALVDPHGAAFHPLNYALGLAAAVEERGGQIFEDSPVIAVEGRTGAFVLRTPQGRVRATHVVVGTDGYTPEVFPPLFRSVVGVGNNVIVTEPLDPELAGRLIPKDRVVYDTKRLVWYFRLTPDRRLLFGGRGVLSGREGPPSFERLRQAMGTVFPELRGCRIEFAWGGIVGFTRDFLPHIGRTEDGIHFALGYCGIGAAASTLMGKLLAQNIRGEDRQRYPLEALPLRPIPLHGQRAFLIAVATLYFKLLDALA